MVKGNIGLVRRAKNDDYFHSPNFFGWFCQWLFNLVINSFTDCDVRTYSGKLFQDL